ncbi:MAG: hypothetical protein Q9213_001545 [Squamulea squamosa]
MHWYFICSGLFALTVNALPATSGTHADAVKSLEVRDVPLWAANYSNAVDSTGAGFGRVQIQYWDLSVEGKQGELNNNGPPIPVVTHPKLGKALEIHLTARGYPDKSESPAQERWEALPPKAALYFNEGDDYYFRFDFVLGPNYPINQRKFNVINQIHQADNKCCSPPVEFDIFSGNLVVHGENQDLGPSATYEKILGAVQVDTKYKVVYHVKFGSTPAKSLLEVWLNDQHVVPAFHPNTTTIRGGPSYWKGASLYARWDVAPYPQMTVFQNAHRVGSTFASVNNN